MPVPPPLPTNVPSSLEPNVIIGIKSSITEVTRLAMMDEGEIANPKSGN